MAGGKNGNDELISFIAGAVEGLRDELRVGFSTVNTRLDGLDTRMSGLDVKITALQGDMERVHIRLDNIENALTNEIAQIRTEVSRLRICSPKTGLRSLDC